MIYPIPTKPIVIRGREPLAGPVYYIQPTTSTPTQHAPEVKPETSQKNQPTKYPPALSFRPNWENWNKLQKVLIYSKKSKILNSALKEYLEKLESE